MNPKAASSSSLYQSTLGKTLALFSAAALLSVSLTSCASSSSANDNSSGTSGNVTAICAASIIGGAGIGGVAGRAVGDMAGSKTAGTIIGATVGGGGGILICRRAWRQAQELEQKLKEAEEQKAVIAALEEDRARLLEEVNSRTTNVSVEEEPLPPPPVADYNMEVVEKRAVRFDLNSSLLFQTGSSKLQPEALGRLSALASSLQENPESEIHIIGHTDASGSEATNQRLSEARAESVSLYLAQEGVSEVRLKSMGKGEQEPAFPNSNPIGRAKNRRVEVIIIPT